MKVYQLMSLLEKYPAGAEARISMTATLDAPIEGVEALDGNRVNLAGGDAMVINENAEEIGWLSTFAEVADDEE